MPTILRKDGYRFFFFSNDGKEAPHIHVERDDSYAKFSLGPVRLLRSTGFNSMELNRMRKIVEQQETFFKEKWHEHFRSAKRT